MAAYYTLHIAGLTRELKICPISEKLDIAAFILFSEFLQREHGIFPRVDHDTHDEFIKNIRTTANDIQMTAGDRVKAARINRNLHIVS